MTAGVPLDGAETAGRVSVVEMRPGGRSPVWFVAYDPTGKGASRVIAECAEPRDAAVVAEALRALPAERLAKLGPGKPRVVVATRD
jgi:hypothetical protein